MINPPEFGKNLKEAMEENGWTQKDLAKWSGLTPAAISQIVNGKREPGLSSIIKIVNATGKTFEELVNGKDTGVRRY